MVTVLNDTDCVKPLLMKRARRLSSQVFLAVAVILVTLLFIVSQQYHFKNLQAIHSESDQLFQTDRRLNITQSKKTVFTKKAKTGARLERLLNLSKEDPLSDYSRYPCVKNLSAIPREKWSETGRCVRTINHTEVSVDSRENCVLMKTFKGRITICTYPVDRDIYISASLQRDGQWEGTLVFNIARLLQSDPDIEFLDIGCNIGAYTLAMAHQGTKVTAVDSLLPNLELLSKSLKLNNLQDNVTLIWNAVSNEHTLVAIDLPHGNVGGANLQDLDIIRDSSMTVHVVNTITLDDLVPLFRNKRLVIKMDIEGSEYKALLGGNLFFDSVDVVLLQMEFGMHKFDKTGQKIADFLESKGLEPYLDLGKRMPLRSSDVSKWSHDVYFLKP